MIVRAPLEVTFFLTGWKSLVITLRLSCQFRKEETNDSGNKAKQNIR